MGLNFVYMHTCMHGTMNLVPLWGAQREATFSKLNYRPRLTVVIYIIICIYLAIC